MSDAAIEAVTNPEVYLTPRESAALEVTVKMRLAKLSPHLENQMFGLFIQGQGCVEIARLNPGITLGQIVRARVESNWDIKRQEHVEALARETMKTIQQTTMESIDFLAAQLAATRKLYGDKIKRYLQTGNEEDLGSFSIHGWRAYSDAVDLLRKLTGQDQKPQKLQAEIHHTHEMAGLREKTVSVVEAEALIKNAMSGKK